MTTFIEELDEILKDLAWDGRWTQDTVKEGEATQEDRDKFMTGKHNTAQQAILNLVSERIIGEDIVYVPGNPFTLTIAKRSRDSVDDENEYKASQRTTLYEGTKEEV